MKPFLLGSWNLELELVFLLAESVGRLAADQATQESPILG